MQTNDKIRRLRELKNYSQEEMAERLQMSTSGYAKIERGETRLNIPKLEQIANVLGIDIMELMLFNERSVICLINEQNSHNLNLITDNHSHSSNFSASEPELLSEIKRLKSELEYKDKLLAQQSREIETLRLLIEKLGMIQS